MILVSEARRPHQTCSPTGAAEGGHRRADDRPLHPSELKNLPSLSIASSKRS